MEDRRRFVPNDDDGGAPVEVRANNKLLRLGTSFAVSTAQREICGDPLHRTELPPSLTGFFFWARVGGGDDTENDELLPPDYPLLPLKNYGQYANLLPKPAAPFVDVDPSFTFITRALPATDFIYLLDSRNGLLLFGHLRDAVNTLETCFIVCNPATEQWAAVPSCGRTDNRRRRGPYVMQPYLMFDPAVSSHFHIVLFWQDPVYHDGLETTTVQAYSSEAGAWSSERDWSEEERLSPLETWRSRYIHDYFTYHIHRREAPGAMVNGMLYLIYTRKWILEVDAMGKTRATIPAPGVEQHQVLAFFSNSVLFIGESQGRLHCIVQEGREEPIHLFPRKKKELMQTSDPDDELLDPDNADAVRWTNHGVSIWVLQDRQTQEWVLKGRVNFLQLFGRSSSDGDFGYRVAAIHPDRNLVFFFQCWDSKMISYDIDRQEVRALDTDFRHGFAITPYVPYLSELFLGVIGARK